MDDLKQQLRRHYDGQQLPADRVQEILAAGREEAAARASRVWWRTAVAAAVIISFGVLGATAYFRNQAAAVRIPAGVIAGVVRDFFTTPDYQLDRISANRAELASWLQQNGGPADFAVPPAMAGLTSYGCEVLDVQGQKIFLICFLLNPPMTAVPAGAMPEKKMMTVTAPDGTMMKKSVPLVHLVVAPREKFASSPQVGERVVQSAGGDWHFSTWTEGGQMYVAAGAVSAERLAGLVGVL